MKFKKIASVRNNPRILMQQKGLRAQINRLWFESADALVLQTESQKKPLSSKMLKKSIIIANPISDTALVLEKNRYDFVVTLKTNLAKTTQQTPYKEGYLFLKFF